MIICFKKKDYKSILYKDLYIDPEEIVGITSTKLNRYSWQYYLLLKSGKEIAIAYDPAPNYLQKMQGELDKFLEIIDQHKIDSTVRQLTVMQGEKNLYFQKQIIDLQEKVNKMWESFNSPVTILTDNFEKKVDCKAENTDE